VLDTNPLQLPCFRFSINVTEMHTVINTRAFTRSPLSLCRINVWFLAR